MKSKIFHAPKLVYLNLTTLSCFREDLVVLCTVWVLADETVLEVASDLEDPYLSDDDVITVMDGLNLDSGKLCYSVWEG